MNDPQEWDRPGDPGVSGNIPAAVSLLGLSQALGGDSIPGVGSLETTYWAINDSVDVGFPSHVDFVLPSNLVKLQSIKVSFKFRHARYYSTGNISATSGAGTAHNHSDGTTGGESNHSHSHNHTITLAASGVNLTTVQIPTGNGQLVSQAGGTPNDAGQSLGANAAGSSGHTHGGGLIGNEASHTHNVSGTLSGQIGEGATNPAGVTVTVIDNSLGTSRDITALLGGPFASDQVELDLTKYSPSKPSVWHEISLTTTQQGRLNGQLKVTAIVNNLRP